MFLCVSRKSVEIHELFTNVGRGEFEEGSRKVRAGRNGLQSCDLFFVHVFHLLLLSEVFLTFRRVL